MAVHIKIQDLYKIFGANPEKALRMLGKGMDKDVIYKETGLTVGVQDANFEIEPGEIFVVMGLSGSGKSTLVRMLNRLIEPTAGHVFIDGQDVATMNGEELLQLRRKKCPWFFSSSP